MGKFKQETIFRTHSYQQWRFCPQTFQKQTFCRTEKCTQGDRRSDFDKNLSTYLPLPIFPIALVILISFDLIINNLFNCTQSYNIFDP